MVSYRASHQIEKDREAEETLNWLLVPTLELISKSWPRKQRKRKGN